MTTKFVIVEQSNFSRRFVAKRGLSFETQEAAEAYRQKQWNHHRLHVETRKVPDIDASQTMHCQCCSRAIHAAAGVIAHHGYQRPGDGWQTQSCYGARRLPWEVDRTAVAELIEHLKGILERSIEQRDAVANEVAPVTHHYQVYDRKVKGGYRGGTITMTRDTFEAIKAANVDSVFTHSSTTFDQFEARDLELRDTRIARLKQDIKELTARYEGWKQTHKWNVDRVLWEAI